MSRSLNMNNQPKRRDAPKLKIFTMGIVTIILMQAMPINGQTYLIKNYIGNGVQGGGSDGDGGKATSAKMGASRANPTVDNAAGYVYVADIHRIRRLHPSYEIINPVVGIAGSDTASSGEGIAGTSARFVWITGIMVGGTTLFIADAYGWNVRKVNLNTNIINIIAGSYTSSLQWDIVPNGDGGKGTAAQFDHPYAIWVDTVLNVYIADETANNVRKVDAATQIISLVAGQKQKWAWNGGAGVGGKATSATLGYPRGLWGDSSNQYLYIVVYNDNNIRRVNMATNFLEAFAGTWNGGETGDGGPAIAASFRNPVGGWGDTNGNFFFAAHFAKTFRKVEISTNIISTVIGNAVGGTEVNSCSWTEGGFAIDAKFFETSSIGGDTSGVLYIQDYYCWNVWKVYALDYPTRNPTIAASVKPSLKPSVIPSIVPSVLPSYGPTTSLPTFTPSESPSAAPSCLASSGVETCNADTRTKIDVISGCGSCDQTTTHTKITGHAVIVTVTVITPHNCSNY